MITPVIGKGPAAIEYAVEWFKADPGGVLGSWLMATIGITFMMGNFATQATNYFSEFGYESTSIFSIVLSCIILSILQWILVLLAAWDWFVAHYGDWATVVYISWPVWSEPIVAQVIVFVAQLFFAYRCYTLYGRSKFIIYGLILVMLASVAMFTMVGVVLAIDPYNFPLNRQFTIPALCINLFTDLSIAGLTLWKLGARGGETFSPSTDDVLRRLRNITFEAAVPPAICAILNMSFFLALGHQNIIFTCFNILTPRFYIWSLMFTLNARTDIRERFNAANGLENRGPCFDLSNIESASQKLRQTDSRRTTVVFATMNGPMYAPNASIGIISESVGSQRGGSRDSKGGSSLAGSELQVDLDRWEKRTPTRTHSEATSVHTVPIVEQPLPEDPVDTGYRHRSHS